jgi:hypothetical protein
MHTQLGIYAHSRRRYLHVTLHASAALGELRRRRRRGPRGMAAAAGVPPTRTADGHESPKAPPSAPSRHSLAPVPAQMLTGTRMHGSLPVVAYSRRAALPRTAAPARPLETRQCSLARLCGLVPRLVHSFSHFRRVLLGLLVRAGDSVFDAPPARASHSAEGAPADAPGDGDDVITTSAPRRPPRNAEHDDVCAGGRVDVRLV